MAGTRGGVRLGLVLLGYECGSRLVGPEGIEPGGCGVCCSRGGELRRTERRGEGVAVSVGLSPALSGHTHLPLTRRCPAIGVPQLRHRGFFLGGGGVPDIVVVVVCVLRVASQCEREVWRSVQQAEKGMSWVVGFSTAAIRK